MSARREKRVSVSLLKAYDVIIAPLVTEKSTMGSEHNQITFRVPLSATKPQIKSAVEEIFKVKVKSVNTLRRKGKTTNFRNIKCKRKDFKHAIITLEEGQTIDTMGGV